MHAANDWGERAARSIFGFAFHLFLATAGSVGLGLLLAYLINAIAPGIARHVEIVPFVAAGAMLASFATPRFCGRSAPWVGIVGLGALVLGLHDLLRYWSPSWSHQTRLHYVLSQLFCLGSGCGDSEGLYALLFGIPFLVLCTYSVVSMVALWLVPKGQ